MCFNGNHIIVCISLKARYCSGYFESEKFGNYKKMKLKKMKKLILLIIAICTTQFLFAQNKVGIGTSTPTQRLSVDSTVNIDQGNFDDGTKPSLRFGSVGNEAIGSRRVSGGVNPFGLDFFTNNTKRLSITNDGKVGIGTTLPFYALHIVAKTGDQAVTWAEGSDVNFVSNYTNSTNTTSFVGDGFFHQGIIRGYVGINPNNDIFLARVRPSQGLQQALIVSNSTGKVGIGVSVPSYALDVFDAEADGSIAHFTSRNPSGSVVRIENTAAGTNVSEISLGFFRNDIFKGKLSVDPTNNLVLSTDVFGTPNLAITPLGRIGVGTSSPSYTLDVVNATNDAYIAHFTGSNAAGSTVRIENTAGGTNISEISLGFFRNDIFKGKLSVDPTNNLVLSTDIFGAPHFAVTPSGNIGIGRTDANFPLNFTNTLGDKIALYGNTANTYGLGVQTNLLQIHSDGTGSDVAIGSGSSTAFTEGIRIKGNGNVGVGITNPTAKLQVVRGGLYTRSEGNGNALEIVDKTGTDHILYMGADATNQLSYIQSVASGGFRNLLLQGRGGNVVIGKDANVLLQVKGDIVADNDGTNTGSVSNGIRFGSAGSGEGIASKRNAGGNQNGLDFYTASTKRMGISNSGNVDVVNNITVANGNGIIRNNSGTQLKMVVTTLDIDITSYAPFQSGSSGASFAEAFSAPPIVYIGNVLPNPVSGHPLGDIDKLMLTITGVTNTGFTFTGHSTHNATIACSGRYQIIAIGPQ